MMQSLKEFNYEFDKILNTNYESTFAKSTNSRSFWITQNTMLQFPTHVKNVLLYMRPDHLSTFTPYDRIVVKEGKISISGHNSDIVINLGISEESYFQQSLVQDISRIPIEFLMRVEQVYDFVCSEFKGAFLNV